MLQILVKIKIYTNKPSKHIISSFFPHKKQFNKQQTMIKVKIDDFMQWIEEQLDKKYSDKLQAIKRLFIIFFNLSNQIIMLYSAMKDKVEKHSQRQEYKELSTLLNHSILVLSKIIETYPKCIDFSFCEKFIKNFDINLNILCTYFHSLHHIALINEQAKFQKEKIVQGINKLYKIENMIKEIFRTNTNVSRILAMINENKKLLSSKIQTIKRKSKECKQKQVFLQNFEPLIVEFYEQYIQQSKEIQPKEDYKKTLIKMYFQLKHQLFSTQLALQNLCKLPLQICEEAKEKKKNHSTLLQENCGTFSRWLGILLKTNYSMKNFKKIKIEQLTKSIQTIVKQYPHSNNFLIELAQKNLEQVHNLATLIIEIVRQLQKIEHSGVISSINDYKDGLFIAGGSKKYVCKMVEYQTAMAKYFGLQEEIKKMKNLAQSIVLQEIGEKVDVVVIGEEGEE